MLRPIHHVSTLLPHGCFSRAVSSFESCNTTRASSFTNSISPWTQSNNMHIKLNLTDTFSKIDVTKPCLTVCSSACVVLSGPTPLYPFLVSQCLPSLNLASTSNLFLKRQQAISKMVEMAVLKAFPLLFLLLWSLLAMALTTKHLSLANIISWLSLPTLLWTARIGNSRYKCNSFKEMWRNQSMWFPSFSRPTMQKHLLWLCPKLSGY